MYGLSYLVCQEGEVSKEVEDGEDSVVLGTGRGDGPGEVGDGGRVVAVMVVVDWWWGGRGWW